MELDEFAAAAFEWLAVGQALIVLALVPAIVAGTIAEERSRQTLKRLFASRLSAMYVGMVSAYVAACGPSPGS